MRQKQLVPVYVVIVIVAASVALAEPTWDPSKIIQADADGKFRYQVRIVGGRGGTTITAINVEGVENIATVSVDGTVTGVTVTDTGAVTVAMSGRLANPRADGKVRRILRYTGDPAEIIEDTIARSSRETNRIVVLIGLAAAITIAILAIVILRRRPPPRNDSLTQ